MQGHASRKAGSVVSEGSTRETRLVAMVKIVDHMRFAQGPGFGLPWVMGEGLLNFLSWLYLLESRIVVSHLLEVDEQAIEKVEAERELAPVVEIPIFLSILHSHIQYKDLHWVREGVCAQLQRSVAR